MIVINIFNISSVEDYNISEEELIKIASKNGCTYEAYSLLSEGYTPSEVLNLLDF